MGKEVVTLPPAIESAIEEIAAYPSVLDIISVNDWDNAVLLETSWKVKLPNAFIKAGVSSTGVRETETVYWRIPLNYPLRAPSPRLRSDFPTNLPHINPYTEGKLVYPCVSEISLEDLLHSQGLSSILNMTTKWLDNAAANELQCPIQGWEPVRRDNTNGIIFIDSESIKDELDKKNNTVRFYDYKYFYATDSNSPMLGKVITPHLGTNNNSYKEKHTGILKDTRHAPEILFQTKPGFIVDYYHPETVSDFKSLKEFSAQLELNNALEIRLKYILSILKSDPSKKIPVEEFLVTFAIKRPFKLIGSNSHWELLPYRICYSGRDGDTLNDDTKVMPTIFIDSCSDKLLQKVSGIEVDELKNIAVLGCGSLGSKISLHLAKTGRFEFELVDSDFYSSHNNARHAVIASDFDSLLTSKPHLLSREISNLNIKSKPIKDDVRNMGAPDGFLLNKKTNFIIDATASLPVRYFLSHQCNNLPGRLIHTVLYAKASLAVVAIEADSRAVRIDDLMTFLNTLCITENKIQNSMYDLTGPERQNYGEGCSSVTTTMSDMDISLAAAAISLKVDNIITQDNPEALLQVGYINPDSLNMEWNSFNFSPTKTIPRDNNFDWNIRILGNIEKDIRDLSSVNPELENGGIIAGQICHLSKTIYVTYLLEAPEGTKRTASTLDINTDGLAPIFDEIHKKTNGQVTFLGTWHSHTEASPPSPKDISTLKKLQLNYDLPIVMLVYTGGRIVRVEQ